jgi:hypothetical protein
MAVISNETLERMKRSVVDRCRERILAAKRKPGKNCDPKEEDFGMSSILKRKRGL